MTQPAHITVSSLKRETVGVYLGQLVAVVILVHTAKMLGFEGALSALIGALFVFLPVAILDRRGRPYGRYGLIFKNPLADVPLVLVFMLITWPPIVAAIFLFPELWQLSATDWQLVIPKGYASVALAHFLVVALPEEFFFRGYLLGRLDDIFSTRFKMLGVKVGHGLWLSSLLFALGHFAVDFHPARLMVFFPALAFGYLRLKRQSIAAPILFHGCCNIFMDLFRAGLGL
ncbi:MAG: CPBP family intramembrane metalloprotease [Deltaproteobacteria bacterium]|nr:CPBP family intramembrane metalloprotease [Deltaproteobacteria bacterium]